jgi:hypothetical protein
MTWQTFKRGAPCPICGKEDWCGWTAAEESEARIVRCMRVDDRDIPGWRWMKTDTEGGTTYIDASVLTPPGEFKPRRRPQTPPEPAAMEVDSRVVEIHDRARAMLWEPERVDECFEYVQTLGLDPGCLITFDIGFTGKAYTVPMRDHTGRIIGVHTRWLDGAKKSVKGSHNGLFIPVSILYDGQPIRPLTREMGEPLVIVEGWTDAAAVYQQGFAVIGRPSNTGAVAMLTQIVRGLHVVVLGDADGRYETNPRTGAREWKQPGVDGPRALIDALVPINKSVRLCTPGSFKDAREWVKAGARRDDMLAVFRSAKPEVVQ